MSQVDQIEVVVVISMGVPIFCNCSVALWRDGQSRPRLLITTVSPNNLSDRTGRDCDLEQAAFLKAPLSMPARDHNLATVLSHSKIFNGEALRSGYGRRARRVKVDSYQSLVGFGSLIDRGRGIEGTPIPRKLDAPHREWNVHYSCAAIRGKQSQVV